MNDLIIQKLMMSLASVASRDLLVDNLKKSIARYEDDLSEKSWNRVIFDVTMLMTKQVTEATPGGIEVAIDEMERTRKGYDLLNSDKSKN